MKKYLLIFALVFACFLLTTSVAQAATYYVDKLGTDDVSHGSGTGTDAWLTMYYAHQQAANGDTIYVNEGTYVEVGVSQYGGLYMNPAKGITWIATGEVIVKPDTGSNSVVYIRGSVEDFSFNGFTFNNDGNTLDENIPTVYVHSTAAGDYTFTDCDFVVEDLRNTTYNINVVGTSASLTIDSSTLTGTSTYPIATYGDVDISNSTLDVSAGNHIFRIFTDDQTLSFDNNTFDTDDVNQIFYLENAYNVDLSLTDNTFNASSTLDYFIWGNNYTATSTITGNTFNFDPTSTNFISVLVGNTLNLDVSDNTFNLSTSDHMFNLAGEESTMVFDNNTFNVGSVDEIFYIDQDGDFDITDNTFDISTSIDRLLDVKNSASDNPSGTIDFTGNTFTTAVNPDDAYLFYMYRDFDDGVDQRLEGGSYVLNAEDNAFSLTNTSLKITSLFTLTNQPTSTFQNNTFTTETENSVAHIRINTTGYATSSPSIINNTFNHKGLEGYILVVGSEIPSGGTNGLDGAIIRGNKVLGAVYWDDTKSPTTHGILVGYNINAQIEHNFIAVGLGLGVKSNGLEYTSGGVYNNVFYNNTYNAAIAKGMGGVDFYNNTVYYDIDEYAPGFDIRYNQTVGGESPNCSVYNNIFYGATPTDSDFYAIKVDDGGLVGFSSDYNSFYAENGDIYLSANGSTANSISEWQTLISDAAHSIEADPLFVATSTNNYYLQVGSPAIGVGTTTLGSTYELGIEKAATWPGPATTTRVTWDLGAYVYEDGVTITESSGSTDVSEGSTTDTYTVVLDHLPTDSVVITVSADSQATTSVETLTFTTGDWSTPQTVTVTAVDDDIDEDDTHTSTITHIATSDDSSYDGITISDVTANITDDDTVGISLSSTATAATEEGSTGSYTVVLSSEPTDNVVITITVDDQISVSPSTLTFTSANWDTHQTVTVTAIDDTVDEDDSHSGTITHSVASDDADYDGYSLGSVTVTITDNDTSGGGGGYTPPPSAGTGSADNIIPMDAVREIGNVIPGGNNLLMYINSKADFSTTVSNFGSGTIQNHSLEITDLDLLNNIVTITIHSDPITLELALDEIKYVDLDNDGINDLEVKFEDLIVNRVEITVKNLNENATSETTTYTLFKYPNNPKVYLLEDNMKRWIRDEYTFNAKGYDWNTIETIDANTTYPDGEDIVLQQVLGDKVSARYTFTSFLNIGSIGEEVRQLQTKLKTLGYFTYEYITGYYGPITAQAVKDFQKANNVEVVGYVGPKTRFALNSD